ncbi:MAG: hypothetical protein GC172_08020 [Phycisphaera sp.]|nr:hypothetical protein [Phycisphaera sp.]
MPEAHSAADSLVFHAIRPDREARRAETADRQELPRLDLVGAAIARAARLAAAEDRARRVHQILRNSQAAALLPPSARDAIDEAATATVAETPRAAREAHMFSELLAGSPDEGRVVLLTAAARGFVWRLHPAPAEAADLASEDAPRADGDCGKPLAPLHFGAGA